jgi:hypothetical protein
MGSTILYKMRRLVNVRVNPEEEQAKRETQFVLDSIDRLRNEYKDIPHNILGNRETETI